ncbi:MAG TPA: NUDIX domain-containing protein [Candidatus Aquilonibacter sp.]|nr:NUDIX domain-containing protein [Candidatus Aquilonibacter sp.]
MSGERTVKVVAALIESDGRVLVCQRRRGDRFALLWEFPGGKVEAGEELSEALARELNEELGVEAPVGPEVYRTMFHYREMQNKTEIIFFAASARPEEVRNLAFERIEWRAPQSLGELDFLPADRDLVGQLASGSLRIPSNWMISTEAPAGRTDNA